MSFETRKERSNRAAIPMNEIDAKTRATAILAAIKKAGINLIASLPDINVLDLIDALERDADDEHVLVREEEGIGICAGARLVGRKRH